MRIACITGSRADWNGLGMVAMALRDAGHDVLVIATGQHGAPGDSTLGVIEADGFRPILVQIPLGDADFDIPEATGASTSAVGHALASLKPDLAIVVGDRYEILGAATAAALLRIQIAHIAGGDLTEGSIDDKLRDAISMLADLHFATNWSSAERLSWMVRNPDKVRMTGSPAIDRIRVTPTIGRDEFFSAVGLKSRSHNILVAYHPATIEVAPTQGCLEMRNALIDLGESNEVNYLLLGSNADADAGTINLLLQGIGRRFENGGAFFSNLSPALYYSALTYMDLLVGNSSAGLYEATSFGIPVVNISPRQDGRLAAANVRTCAPTRDAILHTMKLQLAEGRKPCVNPYGDGHSAARIAKIIGEWRP